MITIAALTAVLDSIAAGVTTFDAALGEGAPGSVSGRADDDTSRLVALNDPAVQRELVGAFATRASAVRASALHRALSGPLLQRALDRHLGRTYGSLSAFLRQHDTRVHENLLAIGLVLDADVVFGGITIVLATWQDGAFVDGAAIDSAQRADAPVELVIEAKGPTPAMHAITLRTRDGLETQAAINVPALGPPIAFLADQRFADVTTWTIDGGDAADRYSVRTIVERS